jgi:hypothetical protein
MLWTVRRWRIGAKSGGSTYGTDSPQHAPPLKASAAPSAVEADGLADVAASKQHHDEPYTPVSPTGSTPAINGVDRGEPLARARQAELATERHRIKLAKLRSERERVEQEAADRETKSRIKRVLLEQEAVGRKTKSNTRRVLLWANALLGCAGVANLIAQRVWEFSHPLGHFELLVSLATCAVSGIISWVGIRSGKSKSQPIAPLDEAEVSLSIDDGDALKPSSGH